MQQRPHQAVKAMATRDSARQRQSDEVKTSLAEKLAEQRQAAQLEETATASGSVSVNAAQMTDEESEMLHLEEDPLLLLLAETSVCALCCFFPPCLENRPIVLTPRVAFTDA